jgi:hypothetical protein
LPEAQARLSPRGKMAESLGNNGAGEGIRTLDPNLGKIRVYEILLLYQIFIIFRKIRTRSEHA